VESVGSPELVLVEGEGMLAIRDYPEPFKALVARAAERAGIGLRRGMRLGLATDALIALRRGYETAALGSVTRYKFPANYHKQTDTAANVDVGTIAAALEVCDALVREVAELGG
jgi:putative aminopeptidase FrvX